MSKMLRSAWSHHIEELFVINQAVLVLISFIENILERSEYQCEDSSDLDLRLSPPE